MTDPLADAIDAALEGHYVRVGGSTVTECACGTHYYASRTAGHLAHIAAVAARAWWDANAGPTRIVSGITRGQHAALVELAVDKATGGGDE